MDVFLTVAAIALVIGLIMWVKVDPVIALIAGSLFLGITADIGLATTMEMITLGFGEIMAKVGLLIGFGVLIGALLHSMGAFRRLVRSLLALVGHRPMPYAMTAVMSTIFPSIYVDVQVVLASPVARSVAPHLGKRGLPLMSGAIGVGIFSGYVFVVPGIAALAISQELGLATGKWLLYGIFFGPITAILTTFIFALIVRMGWWNAETDEEPDDAMTELEGADAAGAGEDPEVSEPGDRFSLGVLLLPIFVPLVLIAGAAIIDIISWNPNWLDSIRPGIAFFGNATLALFIGLIGAYVLSRMCQGTEKTNRSVSEAFHTTGEILLVTGVGGSLGAVIEATTLKDTLEDLFSADAGAPVVVTILLVWFVAALLHLAIGSVSVAAIAAAGIISPVMTQIDIAPVALALAIASGAMFAVQVNSNFFWMFKALLGLSTSGALKTLTVVTSLGSLVSLPLVILVGLIV